jgi:NAD(P)-dependent dehydrogenase (short-subunit alcohol dehydrogenase family)
VLISAGASGIGRCIAETFLAAGHRVHVCDVEARHIDEFLAANPLASATRADVSDPAAVERVLDELLARHQGLDVLVNNAGIAGPTALVDQMPLEGWQRCLDVNLSGAFYLTRLAVPWLRQAGGGSIINISSNAGTHGFEGRSPYTASKWALIGLTKSWAMELGRDRIRVNALCPGSVSGPRIDGVIERHAAEAGCSAERLRAIYLRQSSLRVFVDAQDVANMALYLAGDGGRYISGQAIGIDGHTEGLSVHID